MLIDEMKLSLIQAMRDHNENDKAILQIVIGEINKKDKESGVATTNEDQLSILMKEIKKLNDAIELCGDRVDIKEEYLIKMNTLKKYAPQQLSEDSILGEVEGIISGLNATGQTLNKATVMKIIMPIMRGKADGKLVNKIVDDCLVKLHN